MTGHRLDPQRLTETAYVTAMPEKKPRDALGRGGGRAEGAG